MPVRQSIAIVLAFANDWVDHKLHLRSLLDESKAIRDTLARPVVRGVLAVLPRVLRLGDRSAS